MHLRVWLRLDGIDEVNVGTITWDPADSVNEALGVLLRELADHWSHEVSASREFREAADRVAADLEQGA